MKKERNQDIYGSETGFFFPHVLVVNGEPVFEPLGDIALYPLPNVGNEHAGVEPTLAVRGQRGAGGTKSN